MKIRSSGLILWLKTSNWVPRKFLLPCYGKAPCRQNAGIVRYLTPANYPPQFQRDESFFCFPNEEIQWMITTTSVLMLFLDRSKKLDCLSKNFSRKLLLEIIVLMLLKCLLLLPPTKNGVGILIKNQKYFKQVMKKSIRKIYKFFER